MSQRTAIIRAGLGHAVKAVAAAAMAACSFVPGGRAGDDDAPIDAAEIDGAAIDAADIDAAVIDAAAIDAAAIDARAIDAAAIDARVDAPIVTPLCSNASELHACFTFDNGMVQNGAGTALTITAQNVSAVAGRVGMAAGLGATSVIHIAETPALDTVGPVTFEAFVWLDQAPATNARMGIYDDNGEWGVFVDDQRRPYCVLGATVFGAAMPLTTWTHVACVYDRTVNQVLLYQNGVAALPGTNTTDLSTTATDGSNLGQQTTAGGGSGDPLIGRLDEVRIWHTARTAGEIAAAAARGP